MPRPAVDLTSHINQTIERGHAADFPVTLKPVSYRHAKSYVNVPNRMAVVREDTGQTLAVVSTRYRLVPHQRILDLVGEAVTRLDVGPVPRGIYVDRRGARMRALYKFPELARPVSDGDSLCPCLKIENTYDGRSRLAVHIGAFRFVCTNLAVGGGGIFAGGFMAVRAGEIPVQKMAEQLSSYLTAFDSIVEVYRAWAQRQMTVEDGVVLEALPKRPAEAIRVRLSLRAGGTVYDAYNVATGYATHEMRSYRLAFDLLSRINRSFQERFPISLN